ncbi:ABC transporter substrate-binding protein [Acidisphaera sp. S103]|uniref:ABC transporter substrate-binding protein n=1 Tax=Acidisphaera sp. S103 TaxID=1747223 RepID=UPI00131B6E1D|nr:ABC transporter substrate-binding protein [Acidisphaera sp. S103]
MIYRRTVLAGLAATTVARADEPITIRFGFANVGVDNRQFSGGNFIATAHADHYIDNELKDRPGVKIEYSFFKGAGPAVNEAFANGQLDFASHGDLPEIIGRANGLKTRHVLAGGAHAPLYLAVPPNSDIHTIKDLKGRKVALFRGTNNHLAAVKVLAANGMTERDFQGINMDEASANAALATRNIDAAFGNYGLLLLVDQGLAKIAYTTKGGSPAFERQSTLVASERFVTDHPDLVQRVITGAVKAAYWSSQEQNRDALFDIWVRSGRPASVYRADFAGQTLKYRNTPLIDDYLIEAYRQQAKQAREYGLIRRDVSVDGWFEPRFLNVALKQLNLEHFWTRYAADGKPET